ncbi:DUF2637 domain-containing protein [Nocardia sp. NPDC049707]|uniref:DUF2637 domain-containing protein n=1 Tax=Nocardia sp. NPDC049707 TaxID=3154735 RepID=UPI0034483A51
MTTITTTDSELLEGQSAPADGLLSLIRRLRSWRPRPLHASAVVTGVVALTSFEMSFVALHDLSVRNLVAPALAANVPIAIDGLVIGSIIATATFRRRSSAWWYATALFVFWTLMSVAGNIEYAREIGGSPVSLSLYAGMPLTMLFAVHLTLMLFGREHDRARIAEHISAVRAEHAPTVQAEHTLTAWAKHVPTAHADRVPTAQMDRVPTAQAERTHTARAEHAPTAQAEHTPTAQAEHAPAVPAEHAPAVPAEHAPAMPEDRAPETQEDRDQAAGEDRDSAPQEEPVVPALDAAILENTDPLPVAPKKLPTNTLPGTAAAPLITPAFATSGAGGKAEISPF